MNKMTQVEAASESRTQPRRFFRAWAPLLSVAVVVAISAAAIVGSHSYRSESDDPLKLGLAALERGDFAAVRGFARELKGSQAASPQARLLRGALLLERGYCYPALDELEKAKQEVMLESAALTLIGKAWYRLGRHVEAQAALENVVKQEPDFVEAHRWLAASYYDLGIIDKASSHLMKTAELDPADPRPYRLLGLIHKDFEMYDEAIPFYRESLRRNSNQADVDEIREELAVCQIRARRYRDALATLASCSEQPAADVHRAECLHALGQIAAAKASLERLLKEDPDNLDGILLQGAILLEEEEPRQAIAALEHATRAHPKDYTAHFRLAQAYASVGEQKLADAQREAAEKIRVVRHEFSKLHKEAWQRPGDVQLRLRLASLANELDRPDLADVWLRSAAALQPINVSKNQ
jgi:tetratricopeptide (TPR) repeat protein